uniref:hypothetical protein n=1 Tax=Burkholderia anthina TaxID=179879 RepID=UPI00158A4B90|nr:hypothetical protein [Burkholderia anthina]
MKTIDGTHGPMAAQAFGATRAPVSHDVVFVAAKRTREPCRSVAVSMPVARPIKNPRAHRFSRVFRPSSNRIEAIGGAGDRT